MFACKARVQSCTVLHLCSVKLCSKYETKLDMPGNYYKLVYIDAARQIYSSLKFMGMAKLKYRVPLVLDKALAYNIRLRLMCLTVTSTSW